jgi:hypothetical protein
MGKSFITVLILVLSLKMSAQLKPVNLPPASKEASKVNNSKKPPKLTTQSAVCVNWMADYYKFWLLVLKKGNDQTLDLTSVFPKVRVHFTAGQPTIMTFDGTGGEALILPRHNIVNNLQGIPMESIVFLKVHPNGPVSVVEIYYTPGDYGDVTQILEMYRKTSVPNKLFALLKRSNGQTVEIVISENMSRGNCQFPIKP